MSIDWLELELKISDYLTKNSSDKNATPDATAQFIEDSYKEVALKGSEMYSNGAASLNPGLKDTLLSAFESSFQLTTGSPNILNNSGTIGVVDMWNGVTMQTIGPPPGGVIPVSNLVTSAGEVSPMNVTNSDSLYILASELIKVLKEHSATIKGMNNWLGAGSPPPPVSGPWTGIN